MQREDLTPQNRLKPFISAQKVVMGLQGVTARELLQRLIVPLVADGIVTNAEQFLTDVTAREAQVTTVMENGVAFPHARSHAVRKLGLTVGIIGDEGLLFNPESTQRSRLFFMLAVPSFQPAAHIPMLQALARFARDQKRVEKLLSSNTPGAAARYLAGFRG